MHATRYSYQIPVGNIMPELMDDYFRFHNAQMYGLKYR